MTKEQLEKMKFCLESYKEQTYETFGGSIRYDCCDSRSDLGHHKECVAIECINIIEKEIQTLEFKEKYPYGHVISIDGIK